MQDIREIIDCGGGNRINVLSGGWHSGRKAYLDPFTWNQTEQTSLFRIRPYMMHRGPRSYRSGFELVAGNGYVMKVATADRAKDLFAWACTNGFPAEVIWANSPSVRRSR